MLVAGRLVERQLGHEAVGDLGQLIRRHLVAMDRVEGHTSLALPVLQHPVRDELEQRGAPSLGHPGPVVP